jgi:UDPglucose 6-dehydrogenase
MALIKTGQDNDSPLRIVEAMISVNEKRKRAMADKVREAMGGNVRGKTIAVLGLTFKPNTDDMRDAPSIPLISALQSMGANIRAYDPIGMTQAKAVLNNVTFCDTAYSCAEGASALVIVTEWEQFRALDFERLKQVMTEAAVIDLRNIYRADEITRHGFSYDSVGRPGLELVLPRVTRGRPVTPTSLLVLLLSHPPMRMKTRSCASSTRHFRLTMRSAI